ncbi:MAG: DUF1178 family protein [Limnohabitans sp.]|nr:DUF1178 family protein [Limnohabitans sp.]
MKVLDLQCRQHHVFEGWFGSENEFQDQRARGLVACPMCNDTEVSKKLSAPRLNLTTTRGEGAALQTAPAQTAVSSLDNHVANFQSSELQATLLKMVRHVVANTEDVGDGFAEEARKIHYGESEQRNIRGQATPQETAELMEEGIGVMPLPLPDVLKEPLQ